MNSQLNSELCSLWLKTLYQTYNQLLEASLQGDLDIIKTTVDKTINDISIEEQRLLEKIRIEQLNWRRRSCRIPDSNFYEGMLTRLRRIKERIIIAGNEDDIATLRLLDIKINATRYTIQHRIAHHNTLNNLQKIKLTYLSNEYISRMSHTYNIKNVNPTPIHYLIHAVYDEEGYCPILHTGKDN